MPYRLEDIGFPVQGHDVYHDITIESMLEGDSKRPSVFKARDVPGAYSIYPKDSAAQVWTLHYVNAPNSHVVVYEGDSRFRVTIDDMACSQNTEPNSNLQRWLELR